MTVIVAGGDRVSVAPVSLGEFAEFIRCEAYFSPDHWHRLAGRQDHGGDEVLRRLGYSTRAAVRPVLGVTWFEADAYCRWVGGRLPTRRGAEAVRCRGEVSMAEWCDDWFNSRVEGRGVFPEPPARKRVVGWDRVADSASPDVTGQPIGFRVAFLGAVGGREDTLGRS